MKLACFTFHVGLLFLPAFPSFTQDNENNAYFDAVSGKRANIDEVPLFKHIPKLIIFRTLNLHTFKHNTLCSEKTPTHIFFYVSMKNCSEYTQGLTDSDNVKIRYSLRSMT